LGSSEGVSCSTPLFPFQSWIERNTQEKYEEEDEEEEEEEEEKQKGKRSRKMKRR
jgi:hypothetical protein